MSPREYAHRVYRFDEFSLDLDRETLYRGEHEVHLRPKAFRVLRILLERQGQLVTKAELHEKAWKSSIVTDDSLAHCIADVRRALGKQGFELIRTVPRRGYVFQQNVSHELADPAELQPTRSLPLYRLGAVASMLVAAVLLGFGAAGGGAGFAGAEDMPLPAAAVEHGPLPADVDVHNDYEQGRFFFKRRADGDLVMAEARFRAALERDPSFAPAWIGLAGVYWVRYGEGELSFDEAVPLLGDATRHAVTLAPNNAEAHIRRAFYHHVNREPLLAQQHVETALALDPDDVLILGMLAGQLAHRSRFDEAIELQYRALQGDPTSALQHHNLVWYLLAAGRTAEAATVAEQYRAIKPQAVYEADSLFADVLVLQGNYEQALLLARNIANGPTRDRSLAIIHHALGQHEQADEALSRLRAGEYENSDIYVAEVLAQRGHLDEAAEWLVGAFGSPNSQLHGRHAVWLLSPHLAGLRDDRRWQDLYLQVLEARGDSLLLASAGFQQAAAKERLGGRRSTIR